MKKFFRPSVYGHPSKNSIGVYMVFWLVTFCLGISYATQTTLSFSLLPRWVGYIILFMLTAVISWDIYSYFRVRKVKTPTKAS